MNSTDNILSYEEAVRIQQDMRRHVLLVDEYEPVRLIAGVDVGYDPSLNLARAAIVLIRLETMGIVESLVATENVSFPYIPGLLSFREAPVIVRALSLLSAKPDLLMVDGQGVAHPRRLGIASHVGVLTGFPAIGVAKSKLCGRYEEPGLRKGQTSPLTDGRERLGTVLRSKDNVKPLFISPGHKISQENALDLVIRCLLRHRLPEPTRLADKLSKTPKVLPAPTLF